MASGQWYTALVLALSPLVLCAPLSAPSAALDATQDVADDTARAPNASSTEVTRNPLFWKIATGKTTMYLLGSIHAADKSIYPLPAEIMNAFGECEHLVVEADVFSRILAMAVKMAKTGTYPENDGIERHMSTEVMRKLVKYLKANGLSFKQFRKYKPWFAAMMIEGQAALKAGLDITAGIDVYFLGKARGRKKVLELESVEYQIKLLDGLAAEEQEAMLEATLDENAVSLDLFRQMQQMWLSGDENGIEGFLKEGFDTDPAMRSLGDKILFERNRKMAGKIEEMLEEGGTYFVIAGLAHFVGEKSIIDFLQNRKYKVERIHMNSVSRRFEKRTGGGNTASQGTHAEEEGMREWQ